MKKVYIIIQHCRGRSEMYGKFFSTIKKAQAWCDKENSRPEPSMGWRRSFSVKEYNLE